VQPLLPGPVLPTSTSNGSTVLCATAYQQCGGTGWAGPTCCQEGCMCSGSGGYYMQCTPPLGSSTCASIPSNGLVPSNVQPIVPAAATNISPQSRPGSLNHFGSLGTDVPIQAPAPASTPSLTGPMLAPMPAPTPAPAPSPTPAPLPVLQPKAAVTTSPTLLPTLGPAASFPSAGIQCANVYGQCGGKNWMGAKCCSGQATCKPLDEYYSQCVATVASDATMIMRKDAQIVDLSSSARLAMPHWPLTLLPAVGGVFLATLMLAVLAVRRHFRGRQSYPYRLMLSSEDSSPMLPSPLDAVEVEIA